jgi:DedD protein
MARAISDEELTLKKRARRRLIGAIILVMAVVVVLPMVLDSEPKPDNQDISIRIPPTDSGTFTPKVAPTIPPAVTTVKPAPAMEPKPVAAPSPAPTEKSEAAAKPEPEPKPAPAAKPAVEKSKAATSYVVQVVALSDADKAKALEQRISAAGIKAYTEVVKTEKGDVTRVRVGPFPSRGAAEGALAKLKGMSLDGKIVTVK